jgi:hypothetical protein
LAWTVSNLRGPAEQWIGKGWNAIDRTQLSCRWFAAHVVGLQLDALAHDLDNVPRRLAILEPIKNASLASQKEELTEFGAKVVSRGR